MIQLMVQNQYLHSYEQVNTAIPKSWTFNEYELIHNNMLTMYQLQL